MNHFTNQLPHTSVQTVKEMLTEDQPREKLQQFGPESLTNAELLAILLRTGTKNLNVLDLSRSLLQTYGGLHQLARKQWQELRYFKGIGRVKSITLEAIFELARRLQNAPDNEPVVLRDPDAVARFFGPKLRDASKERFLVAFLNNAKTLLGYQQISQGGKTSTIVETSEVMRLALLYDANSIILSHNHPSGIKRASKQDIELTKRIQSAGNILGIGVDDHVIICGNEYVSLMSEGLL